MAEKIKVYRFMSDMEHQLLLQGQHIVNHTDYGKYRRERSTSVGFAFGIGDKTHALYCSRRLKGVVTMRWLMVAEADKSLFTKSQGYYPSLFNSNGDVVESSWFDELCLIHYSLKMFDDVKFYRVNGIDERTRLAFVGGMATRKERWILQQSNMIAEAEYQRIVRRMAMNLHDYDQWRVDNRKGIMRKWYNDFIKANALVRKYSKHK